MTDTPLTYLFGISEYTTWHWRFEDDVERYAGLGAQAIEVCEFKLDEARIDAQLESVAAHGLTISSVQPRVHTLYPDTLEPEPAAPAERMACVRRCIERVGPHAPPGTPFVLNTGIAPDGNFREAWDVAAREFRTLADFAAAHGMRLALEPLNPILMNKNSFIWTIPQAMEIIAAVDRTALGLCLDLWNVWTDARAAEHIRAAGGHISVVHVSDWHRPRTYADRTIIGRGEIPMAQLLRAVREAGYAGAYTLEIFSSDSLLDSLWQADGREVIRESKEGLARAWHRSLEGGLGESPR